MDELIQWFGEQLDEDERIARAAHAPNWSTDGRRGVYYGVEDSWMTDALTTADADHIAAHDPARALREIDAKRQVLRALESAEVALRNTEPGKELHALMTGSVNSLRAAVRMLAAAYSDRPGYTEV
ncbi:DUF6221 family protein [Streptomyces sp. NPDC015125]|uniref:DUF6221 family protein n=1 Tax=Streptomyces sp. NPDC015125 TaxID=3364938 RepID=UPI0036FB96AF